MSMLDPRSNCCPLAEVLNKFGYGCKYYIDADLYEGFIEACLHPKCQRHQTVCPLTFEKEVKNR